MPGFCRRALRVSPLSYQTAVSGNNVQDQGTIVLTLMGPCPIGGRFFSGRTGHSKSKLSRTSFGGHAMGTGQSLGFWKLHLRFYSWSTASLTHAPAALRRTPEGSVLESANPEAPG